MNKIKTIKFVIDSSIELTPLVRRAVHGICSSIAVEEQELFQLELCIVEAVNNIITHAYENQVGHDIEVHFNIGHDYIIIEAFDTGKCGNPLTMEEEFTYFNPDDYSTIPESGMGVFIMKSFMDEVFYKTDGGRNVVTMRKNFKKALSGENGNSH